MCGARMASSKVWGEVFRRDQEIRRANARSPITLQITAVHPEIHFSLSAVLRQDSVSAECAETTHVAPDPPSLEDEIWPYVEHLGITREQADAAALAAFPGTIFGWAPGTCNAAPTETVIAWNSDDGSISESGEGCGPDCTDPVLALGVLARVNGSFYQAGRSPDYTIGHLMQAVLACSDSRPSRPSASELTTQIRMSTPMKRSA